MTQACVDCKDPSRRATTCFDGNLRCGRCCHTAGYVYRCAMCGVKTTAGDMPAYQWGASWCFICVTKEKTVSIKRYSANVLSFVGLSVSDPSGWRGVEWEVKTAHSANHTMTCAVLDSAVRGWAILKADRSLGPTGVEVVTRPMPYSEHVEMWSALFKSCEVVPLLSSDKDCGLHVHVPYPRTRRELGRWFEFLNAEENWIGTPSLKTWTGRRPNHQCINKGDAKAELVDAEEIQQDDRHSTLSFTTRNPGRTVEIRVFASTRRLETLLMRLQFVEAMIAYCKEDRTLSVSEFVRWLATRPDFDKVTRRL